MESRNICIAILAGFHSEKTKRGGETALIGYLGGHRMFNLSLPYFSKFRPTEAYTVFENLKAMPREAAYFQKFDAIQLCGSSLFIYDSCTELVKCILLYASVIYIRTQL